MGRLDHSYPQKIIGKFVLRYISTVYYFVYISYAKNQGIQLERRILEIWKDEGSKSSDFKTSMSKLKGHHVAAGLTFIEYTSYL